MKDNLQWVPLYLAWDEKENTVKLKVDKKEDFPMAVGLLLRVSLEGTKDILLREGEKRNESTNND